MGPDYKRAMGSFGGIVGLAVLTLAFPCTYFYTEFSTPVPTVLTCTLTFLSLFSLLLTSTTNPGILPKQLNGFSEGPRNVYTLQSQSLNYSGPSVSVAIAGFVHKLKYCEVCT